MISAKEDDFGTLLQSQLSGCGSISKIVGHSRFQQRLRRYACRDFGVFRGERGPDDLCQDVSLKLLEAELNSRLQIPDNVQTEDDFFIWLFFVVRHHHYDTIRHRLALKRDGLRSDKPVEDFDPPVWDGDHDREEILGLFPEFIKRYPAKRQLVIRLWLKDKPYRRIEKVMKRLGVEISHTTAMNWVNATIEDFKESLESPPSQQRVPPQRRTGT